MVGEKIGCGKGFHVGREKAAVVWHRIILFDVFFLPILTTRSDR